MPDARERVACRTECLHRDDDVAPVRARVLPNRDSLNLRVREEGPSVCADERSDPRGDRDWGHGDRLSSAAARAAPGRRAFRNVAVRTLEFPATCSNRPVEPYGIIPGHVLAEIVMALGLPATRAASKNCE